MPDGQPDQPAPPSLEKLWQCLLGNNDALSAVIARLSPASLSQLRLAVLPGDRSGASGVELLRVKRLYYSPTLADQPLQRVVVLPCWQAWDDRRKTVLERGQHLTSLKTAWVRLPEDPGLLQPVFSAASAHLTSLNLHPAAPAFHPAYDPKPVPSTAAAPAQLAQLTSLQHLQLGHYISEYFEGWWRPPSVAMLSGLAGLRELRLNTIPADLGRLTQLTRLEARLGHDSSPRQDPLALAPLASLTGLRHLTLKDMKKPSYVRLPRGEDEYSPAERQELAHLSTLTALTSLQLGMCINLSQLPPLPALRALATLAGLEVGVLSQVPQLTQLQARWLLGADGAGVQPCPALRHASVGCLDGLPAIAPELQHLTLLDVPEGDMAQLVQLEQLRSLQLPEYTATALSADVALQLAARCTSLVLTHFDCQPVPPVLALARSVQVLELHMCKGPPKCSAGLCTRPNLDYGDDIIWASDTEEASKRAAEWLAAMAGSSVRELLLSNRHSHWYEESWEWLGQLATWRSLQRLCLRGLYPGGVDDLAARCLEKGSPLSHMELDMAPRDQWMQGRQATCAAVERANPRITCTAPVDGFHAIPETVEYLWDAGCG